MSELSDVLCKTASDVDIDLSLLYARDNFGVKVMLGEGEDQEAQLSDAWVRTQSVGASLLMVCQPVVRFLKASWLDSVHTMLATWAAISLSGILAYSRSRVRPGAEMRASTSGSLSKKDRT